MVKRGICEMCGKNPLNKKPKTEEWNICSACSSEMRAKEKSQKSFGKTWCPNCQRLYNWNIEYKDGKKEEWINEVWKRRRIDKPNSGVCSDECEKEQRGGKDQGGKSCEKCKQKVKETLTRVENLRTKQVWNVCDECFKCELCKKNDHNCITNERDSKWETGIWLCDDCYKNGKGNKKNKPTDKGNKPKSDEICERCQKSCKKLISDDKVKGERTYRITFKQITCYRVDFVKEIHYFGTDCPCAEEFKLEHHWTCPKCGTRDWPDLNKGWVLDYEIKNCFCSAKCHVEYRQMKWEEAQRLTQVELPAPEINVSANEGKKIDWEKEGLKREVLFWREYARSLERNQNNPNLTPQERQQADYLRNLQQNTLRNAESAYQSRYGTLNEDGSDKGKGLSGGMIALIIIGTLALVGGLIFLLTRNKKSKK